MTLTAAPAFVEYDPVRDKAYRQAKLGRDVVDWLAWLELGGASSRTLDQYERDLSRGALLFPSKGIADLTDGDAFHIAKMFKPAERRVRVAAWRSFYKWGRQTRRVTVNPFDALPDIKQKPQPVPRVFNEAEVEALLNLPVVDAAPLGVLLLAGLRKAEARHLRLQDCLPETKEIVVLHGKGARDRLVPMWTPLQHLLNELMLTERLEPTNFVFYAIRANASRRVLVRDRPIGDGTFARWWRRCLDQAAVSYRNPHVARHTYATNARKSGLAMDEIKVLLGHASIATTEAIYVHTGVADVAEHMARIEAGV